MSGEGALWKETKVTILLSIVMLNIYMLHYSPIFMQLNCSIPDVNNLNDPIDVSPALIEQGLSKQCSSKDEIINNEGKKLLEICKTNNLIILNGYMLL